MIPAAGQIKCRPTSINSSIWGKAMAMMRKKSVINI